MKPSTFSICSRCRRFSSQFSYRHQWLNISASKLTPRRYRSSNSIEPRKVGTGMGKISTNFSFRNTRAPGRPPSFPASDVALTQTVRAWTRLWTVHRRLESFGIPRTDSQRLLTTFAEAVTSGSLFTPENVAKYSIRRISEPPFGGDRASHIDRVCTNIFYMWAIAPETWPSLERIGIPNTTIQGMRRLVESTDISYPADQFPGARKMRRKVIMHVGPTNSGKTHNALRALAAAKVGLYAGPLRLLAHEIWERLNLGQIPPLGIDVNEEAPPPPEMEAGVDVGDGLPTVVRKGNLKWARPCNMVTGEEQKIVMDGAPLLSSTVEMISFSAEYDVAVVDEIQMIADPERGGAWTAALLGVCAKELHLCGEETAVPLIESLLQDTGDELIVHRYQRLTPLTVETTSLNGDISAVRKGDCVVTFSRKSIFALKRRIEELTGLRCAVVYGSLPPELRSEQAELFNDPKSGYDVIIGSDAIGMGLNLKIKRIVFEAVSKFDGNTERILAPSQIKQIAGRAGRYGLHGDDSSGGLVTTLYPNDIAVLKRGLDAPIMPLRHARLQAQLTGAERVVEDLPPGASTETIYEAHIYVSGMQPSYLFAHYPKLREMTNWIDTRGGDLILADRILLMMAPIPWRDPAGLDVFEKVIRMYRSTMNVDIMVALQGTEFIETMQEVERQVNSGSEPNSTPVVLSILESFHKVLVLYMWLSQRNPVTYHQHDEVSNMKLRVEKLLDWCLEGISVDTDARKMAPFALHRTKQRSILYRTGLEHGRDLQQQRRAGSRTH